MLILFCAYIARLLRHHPQHECTLLLIVPHALVGEQFGSCAEKCITFLQSSVSSCITNNESYMYSLMSILC
jgi:hypothetical protein